MKLFDKIKKFFSKEAPYNWGASIEHLRKRIEDDYRIVVKDREFTISNLTKLQDKLDQQAAFYSDQIQSVEETNRLACAFLEAKIAKLEKKLNDKKKAKK